MGIIRGPQRVGSRQLQEEPHACVLPSLQQTTHEALAGSAAISLCLQCLLQPEVAATIGHYSTGVLQDGLTLPSRKVQNTHSK